MCRMTLVPIIKPPIMNTPHPQTVLHNPKRAEQVLSHVELELNNNYLKSHGLPPEEVVDLPEFSSSPSSQTFETPAIPSALYHAPQLPRLPSSGYVKPQQLYYPQPLRQSAFVPKKQHFPTLVPNRVVPRSQLNLAPLRLPPNYGVEAFHCQRVLLLYKLYHTQQLRPAEPESMKMPHLCEFIYGPAGNVFWQDGRHVGEGEAGEVMTAESYVDGLLAYEAEALAKTKVGSGEVSGKVPAAPTANTAAWTYRPVQSFQGLLSVPGGPEVKGTNTRTASFDAGAVTNNRGAQIPSLPLRAPSPRYNPAEHKPIPPTREAILASVKKMIGVDENWNKIETLPREQQHEWNWRVHDVNSGEQPSQTSRAVVQPAAGATEGISSGPRTRRRSPPDANDWGHGKEKAPKRQRIRRRSCATTPRRADPTGQRPRTWRPLSNNTSPTYPPFPMGQYSPFAAATLGSSTADIYSPSTIPNPPSDFSAAYIYPPTTVAHPPSTLADTDSALHAGNPADIPALTTVPIPPALPDSTTSIHSLPFLEKQDLTTPLPSLITSQQDRDLAGYGQGSKRSRASTTSLPYEPAPLWSAEAGAEGETPVTLWTSPLDERRTEDEMRMKGKVGEEEGTVQGGA